MSELAVKAGVLRVDKGGAICRLLSFLLSETCASLVMYTVYELSKLKATGQPFYFGEATKPQSLHWCQKYQHYGNSKEPPPGTEHTMWPPLHAS